MNIATCGPIPKADKYAWPGAYPIMYLMNDGELLCADCVNDPSNPVHFGGDNDGWRIESVYVHYEGGPEFCAHCGDTTESAYGRLEDES